MFDKVVGGSPLDTKVVKVKVKEEGTAIPLMITAFEDGNNEILRDAGWRGRYVIFSLIEGGVQDSFADPYKASSHFVSDVVRDFMLDVRQGWQSYGKRGINWAEIEDGQVFELDPHATYVS